MRTKLTTFVFKLKHDNGVTVIRTKARTKKAAIAQICEAEGCPPSALN
jgi:hypothetical protein